MSHEIEFTYSMNFENLLSASNKYLLELTYTTPPTEIKSNRVYFYLENNELKYAVINLTAGTDETIVASVENLSAETIESIKKTLQNSSAKLSEEDEKAVFKFMSEKGFSPAHETISSLCSADGFLTDRNESRFLTINSTMPAFPSSDAYYLIKKPGRSWELIYVEPNGKKISKDIPEALEKILLEKETFASITTAQEKEKITDLVREIDYQSGLNQLKKDKEREWKINNLDSKKDVLSEENCPGIRKYAPYHNQSLGGAFKTAFDCTLQNVPLETPKEYKPLVLQQNYATHIKITPEDSKVTMSNDLLIIGIPMQADFVWIPGYMQMDFASASDAKTGRIGQKFESYKCTNKVLQDLFTGNIIFQDYANQAQVGVELKKLKAEALTEESKNPEQLYQWYKKITNTFLEGLFSSTIDNAKLNYIDIMGRFIEEFKVFLIDSNMMVEFEADKEFSENFKSVVKLRSDNKTQIILSVFEREKFKGKTINEYLADFKTDEDRSFELDKIFKNKEKILNKYLVDFKTDAEQLAALNEIFKLYISTNNIDIKNLSEFQKTSIRLLKQKYMGILESNSEDKSVAQEMIKRGGLVDFNLENTGEKSPERKAIEKIQAAKFKYTAENMQELILIANENTGEGGVARDIIGSFKINGQKYDSLEMAEQSIDLEKYTMFNEYVSIHDQQNLYVGRQVRDSLLMSESGFQLVGEDYYTANLEVDTQSAKSIVETTTCFIAGNKKIFSIPGRVQLVTEKDQNGGVKKTFKFSNTVLRDLHEGKVKWVQGNIEKNEEILRELQARAKKEETPEALYQWHKEQAEIFLEEGIENNFKRDVLDSKGIDYNQFIQNFFFETTDFLIHHPELQKKFHKDKEFSDNFKKIEAKIDEKDKINNTEQKSKLLAALAMPYLGDGRNGDPKAEKIDKFNEPSLESYLISLNTTPAQKLKILGQLLKIIDTNPNHLYMRTNVLTAMQKNHITLLQEKCIQIVQLYPLDPDVQKVVKGKNDLIDFSESQNKNSQEKTKARKILDNLYKSIDENVIHLSAEQTNQYRDKVLEILEHLKECENDKTAFNILVQKFEDLSAILKQTKTKFSLEEYTATLKYYLSEQKIHSNRSEKLYQLVEKSNNIVEDENLKNQIKAALSIFQKISPSKSYARDQLSSIVPVFDELKGNALFKEKQKQPVEKPKIAVEGVITLTDALSQNFQQALNEILKHLRKGKNDLKAVEGVINKFNNATDILNEAKNDYTENEYLRTFKHYFSQLSLTQKDTDKLEDLINIGSKITQKEKRYALINQINAVLKPGLDIFNSVSPGSTCILDEVVETVKEQTSRGSNEDFRLLEKDINIVRKMQPITINQIVDYVSNKPQNAEFLFQQRFLNRIAALGRKLQAEILVRPDLIEKLNQNMKNDASESLEHTIERLIILDQIGQQNVIMSYESSQELYAWYKQKIENFENGILAFESAKEKTNSVTYFKKLVADFHQFMAQCPEKLKNEEGFLAYSKKIESLANSKVMFTKTVIVSLLTGDTPSEQFSKENLQKYLKLIENPADQLKALEEIHAAIIENKNNLYTPKTKEDKERILTQRQRDHIAILNLLHAEISSPMKKVDTHEMSFSQQLQDAVYERAVKLKSPETKEYLLDDLEKDRVLDEIIRELAGDGREGDISKKEKKKGDSFTKDNLLLKLETIRNPVKKLEVMEAVINAIKANENKLYTNTGLGLRRYTTTQEQHMNIAREVYAETATQILQDDTISHTKKEEVEKMAKDENNIINADYKYIPEIFRRFVQSETVDRLNAQITEYQLEVYRNNIDYEKSKNMCINKLGEIKSTGLRNLLIEEFQAVTKEKRPKPLPGEAKLSNLVLKLNEKLDSEIPITKAVYRECCAVLSANARTVDLFTAMAGSLKFPEDGYKKQVEVKETAKREIHENVAYDSVPENRADYKGLTV